MHGMNPLTIKERGKADKIIAERFQVSLMSNTKWEKLLHCVTGVLEEVFINFKLIYSDEIYPNSFTCPDFSPYFIEPILYKEVEWIEFPIQYEAYVNRNNLKAGKKFYKQDVSLIVEAVEKIGQFDFELTDLGFKIYAYR